MSTPILSELAEPPVVGQHYLVPCVKIHVFYGVYHEAVLHGSWHEDAELIGFADHHWHIDLRFVSRNYYKLLSIYGESSAYNAVVTQDIMLGEPKLRRRRCKREFPPFRRGILPELHAAFAGRSLINGHCPHKGHDLRGIPTVDGCVTCPLHGLQFRDGVCQPQKGTA